ncbi:hypothetical protein, partial [Ferrimicrobium sp.]
ALDSAQTLIEPLSLSVFSEVSGVPGFTWISVDGVAREAKRGGPLPFHARIRGTPTRTHL